MTAMEHGPMEIPGSFWLSKESPDRLSIIPFILILYISSYKTLSKRHPLVKTVPSIPERRGVYLIHAR